MGRGGRSTHPLSFFTGESIHALALPGRVPKTRKSLQAKKCCCGGLSPPALKGKGWGVLAGGREACCSCVCPGAVLHKEVRPGQVQTSQSPTPQRSATAGRPGQEDLGGPPTSPQRSCVLKGEDSEEGKKWLVMKERVQEKIPRAAYRGHPFPEAQKALGADHLQEQRQHPDAPGPEGRRQHGAGTGKSVGPLPRSEESSPLKGLSAWTRPWSPSESLQRALEARSSSVS